MEYEISDIFKTWTTPQWKVSTNFLGENPYLG